MYRPPEEVQPQDREESKALAEVGAHFALRHLERPMNVYPVHESELESISFLNPLVTALFSIGSALILFALGLIADLAVEGQLVAGSLNPYGRALLFLVTPVLGVLGLASYIGGIAALRKRRSIWRQIKDESRIIRQPGSRM